MELTMPKNYSVISENELIYVDGGLTFTFDIKNDSIGNIVGATCGGALAGSLGGPVTTGIGAGVAAIAQTAWEVSQGNISIKISW